jgi:hypothetical protein
VAKTVKPRKDFSDAAGVKYTLKTGTFPAGIELDEDSGEISIVANTAVVQDATDYVIVARATGAGYEGTKEATAKIKISSAADDNISGYKLKYDDLAVEQGSTGSVSPTGTIPAGANVGYSLPTGMTLPTGITLDAGTGAISISAAAATKTKTAYTIVATATGTGFTGSKETSVSITIAGKDISAYNLSYEGNASVVGLELLAVPSGTLLSA